ncbi:MAG: FAD binding domain-containing protein [Acidimicrobiales bacterium]
MSRFSRPQTLAVACEQMASGEWQPMAGATDIYPASVSADLRGSFLDVTGIDGMGEITHQDGIWSIGGAATWSAIAQAPLPPFLHGLQAAAAQIGGTQIQRVATLAGNLCTASPAGDGVPILLTLDATVVLASQRGVRSMAVSEFVTGYRQSAISGDELLISIDIPDRPEGRSNFQKLGSRSHLVISIVMVSAVLSLYDDSRLHDVALAVGACSPVAKRIQELEQALEGTSIDEAMTEARAYDYRELAPIDDVRGTAGYRNDVVPTLVARAIQQCASQSVEATP